MILGIDGMPYALTFDLSFADATAAPVWVDYTSRLLSASLVLSGREYAFDICQPGQFEFALDCSDGHLDPRLNADLRPNNQFRITAQATSVSAVVGIGWGYVDSWARTFPPAGRDSYAFITGTDVMKYLHRRGYDSGGARAIENTGVRIDAITGGDTDVQGVDGYQVVSKTYTGTESQLDVIQDLTLGAGGMFFIDGSGTLIYQTPAYRGANASSTTAQCTYVYGKDALGTTAGNADIEIDEFETLQDEQLMANYVTVTDGALGTHVASDAAAETDNDRLEFSLTTDLTAAAATTRASGLLAARKTARTRVDKVTFDALTSTDTMAEVLRRKLSDRIKLKVWAQGDSAGWTQDCFVEAIEHTISLGADPAWQTSMSLSYAS